ncbi:MAG: NAD-dependent epimerase/dehydratase family protein [Thermoleophilaceae bacterium]|nr:NAD-dependent epimerase/dehydratase family protein [Thermoleophilaceae bacterium]
MGGHRVLITGISTPLGGQLARRLEADPDVDYLAGVDSVPPSASLERTEFVEADIRDPELAELLPGLRVDTVVHNNILRRPRRGMSPQTAHDINVLGTLQLLTACERLETLRTIVVRGSAGIYGSEPAAPQFFTEEMSRLYPQRTRFQRDVGEIENYFAGYARRRPAVTCTMLRYQPAIGPSLDTQVTRYLSPPVVPTYLGFDPRLQFVHETDGLEALVAAVRRPVRGAVNVASEGTIGLTKLVRMARRPTLPLPAPLFAPTVEAGRRAGMPMLSPDFRRLLRYGRAVDITRLTGEVGFRPRFTTEAAVTDYLRSRRAPARATPGDRTSEPPAA